MSDITQENEPRIFPVGDIGNYYGGLRVKTEDGKRYWSIENYSGDDWSEIPDYLFRALVQYEHERNARP